MEELAEENVPSERNNNKPKSIKAFLTDLPKQI